MIYQGFLAIMFPFAAGVFIRDGEVPDWWSWLPPLSLFQHATGAMVTDLWPSITYTCGSTLTPEGSCVYSGVTFPCDRGFNATEGSCFVSGKTTYELYKDIDGKPYEELGYLILIGCVHRLFVLATYYISVPRMAAGVHNFFRSKLRSRVIELSYDNLQLRTIVN